MVWDKQCQQWYLLHDGIGWNLMAWNRVKWDGIGIGIAGM